MYSSGVQLPVYIFRAGAAIHTFFILGCHDFDRPCYLVDTFSDFVYIFKMLHEEGILLMAILLC